MNETKPYLSVRIHGTDEAIEVQRHAFKLGFTWSFSSSCALWYLSNVYLHLWSDYTMTAVNAREDEEHISAAEFLWYDEKDLFEE